MNILILGSGGREHALAWKMTQSKLCKKLFIAPGNPGTASLGTNVNISVNDFDTIKDFCLRENIEMLIVGPEEPLVRGIYDFFRQDSLQHIHVIGPSKNAAQLEGSKAFAKAFMQEMNIPTARYKEFTAETFEEGIRYVSSHSLPIVLKADGLAAGKGVLIAQSHQEAVETFTDMIRNQKFGDAGSKVVVEEFLKGIECSVFVLTDGKSYCLLPAAKDYKRIGEGDQGLNTGGMGAISPVPFMDDNFMEKITQRIIQPTLEGLQKRNLDYKGFIFFGLIKVDEEPYVIEYNCRMGDPETEVVMPRINADLGVLLTKLKNQELEGAICQHHTQHAATIVLVSKGYPEQYEKGKPIQALDHTENSILFHAGTSMKDERLVTSGGRVIAVTSLAETLEEAIEISKRNAELIHYEGKYYRRDIGWEFV